METEGPRQKYRCRGKHHPSSPHTANPHGVLVKKRKTVLSWLLPGSFEDVHADISKTRQKGTGAWLLDALEDLQWEQGNVLLVWGHGIGEYNTLSYSLHNTSTSTDISPAGAGKTFLRYDLYSLPSPAAFPRLTEPLPAPVSSIISDSKRPVRTTA